MKKKRTSKKNKNRYAERLLSYTTAASVGALGVGECAEGAVQFFDIPDVTVSTLPPDPNSDFEDAVYIDVQTGNVSPTSTVGVREIKFRARFRAANNQNSDGSAGAGDLAVANTGAVILAPVVQDYYIDPFASGASIGPGASIPTGLYQDFLTLPYKYTYTYGSSSTTYSVSGGQFGAGFLGFRFNLGPGQQHFGWAEVDVSAPGSSPATMTIKSLAFQDVANMAIAAGDQIPEPCSLGLLAAGAGALALRRRKRA